LYGLGAWLQEVEKSVGREDHHCFLVGNKIDLQEDIDVEKKTAESFLKEKDFVQLFEVSAKSGAGVRSAFQAIAEHLVKTYTPSNKNQTLEEGTAPRISRGACCQ
jgi:GTPase SAR1 family protein